MIQRELSYIDEHAALPFGRSKSVNANTHIMYRVEQNAQFDVSHICQHFDFNVQEISTLYCTVP